MEFTVSNLPNSISVRATQQPSAQSLNILDAWKFSSSQRRTDEECLSLNSFDAIGLPGCVVCATTRHAVFSLPVTIGVGKGYLYVGTYSWEESIHSYIRDTCTYSYVAQIWLSLLKLRPSLSLSPCEILVSMFRRRRIHTTIKRILNIHTY